MMRLDRDGRLWLLYLQITDTQFLEVFPEATGNRAPPREANGLNHLCLEVGSIDQVVAELEAAGVPLASPKKLGADGNMQAWIEDPDGNRIELMQMTPTPCRRRRSSASGLSTGSPSLHWNHHATASNAKNGLPGQPTKQQRCSILSGTADC